MSARTLFDSIDADELALVTRPCGFAIACAQGEAMSPMARDPRISPDALVAGVCKAHALGLASMIVSAGLPLRIEGLDLIELQEQLLAASVAVIRAELAQARSGKPYAVLI